MGVSTRLNVLNGGEHGMDLAKAYATTLINSEMTITANLVSITLGGERLHQNGVRLKALLIFSSPAQSEELRSNKSAIHSRGHRKGSGSSL